MNKIRIWFIKRLLKREEKNVIKFALDESKLILKQYECVNNYHYLMDDLGEYTDLKNLNKIFKNE